jgi:hypothetical protein
VETHLRKESPQRKTDKDGAGVERGRKRERLLLLEHPNPAIPEANPEAAPWVLFNHKSPSIPF